MAAFFVDSCSDGLPCVDLFLVVDPGDVWHPASLEGDEGSFRDEESAGGGGTLAVVFNGGRLRSVGGGCADTCHGWENDAVREGNPTDFKGLKEFGHAGWLVEAMCILVNTL